MVGWGQHWGRGICYSPNHSTTKPWRVKFFRQGKWIYIGDYVSLRRAQAAANDFLRNEQCLSQLADYPIKTALN
jgi:hypothetical protein